MKYVIREKDCSDEFSNEMNFSHDYHSDIIAEYIRRQCLTDGVLDRSKLENNRLYNMYQNYKNIDIKQEFFDFMSEVANLPLLNTNECDKWEEDRYINSFNHLTKSTLTQNHVRELTENFNIRQANLNRSMEEKITIEKLIK